MRETPFQDRMHMKLQLRYQSDRYQMLFALARTLGRCVLEYRATGWDDADIFPGQTWKSFQDDTTWRHLYTDDWLGWYSEGVIAFVGVLVVPTQDLSLVDAMMKAHPQMEYRWLVGTPESVESES